MFRSNSFPALAVFLVLRFTTELPAVELPAAELLNDTFEVSENQSDVNFEIGRQTGSLAPISYWDGGEPIFSQVGLPEVPDALLLAGRTFGSSGMISPNHDFVEDPGLGQAFVIEFDVNPVLVDRSNYNTTQTSWLSVNFGTSNATRNQFPQLNDGIGLLFRGDGMFHAFDNGVFLGQDSFIPEADDIFHHIRIEMIDSLDGNPFDGSGSPVTVRAFADGSLDPFFTHIRSDGFSSNFIGSSEFSARTVGKGQS